MPAVQTLQISRQPKTVETTIARKPPASRPYAPPTSLPFDKLEVRCEATDDDAGGSKTTMRPSPHCSSGLANRASRVISTCEAAIGDLLGEKNLRAAALLEALQSAFDLATDGENLCHAIADSWKAEKQRLQDKMEAEVEKAAKALKRLFPQEDKRRLTGRTIEVEAVRNLRQSIAAAGSHGLSAQQSAIRLQEAAQGVLRELRDYADYLRR